MRRGVLALAAAALLAALAFGSQVLYALGVGLGLASLLAAGWVALASGPARFRRRVAGPGDRIEEGDDVTVDVELELAGRLLPASVVVVDRIAKLGERSGALRRDGGRLAARYELSALPRGRYRFEETYAVLEDPFGIERRRVPLAGAASLLVYPRLVELEGVFSEGGAGAGEGRRLLLRRPSGFHLHSVREYEHGESLRKVHWRTTAKRGQLMVKELEDAPRDDVGVLLDAEERPSFDEPARLAFDVQVRGAAALLQAHARRGRRALLVVSSATLEVQRVHSCDGDWRLALDLLAAAEPTGRTPLSALLTDEASPVARAPELTIVTAAVSTELVDRLVRRTLAPQQVALVYVDSTSFRSGAAPSSGREPALVRLQAAGVPVAVLRRGDDLAAKLALRRSAEAAHA